MTAPVFVVDAAALVGAAPGSLLTVGGAEGRHAVTVRRIRAGESVQLVDGAGRRAVGIVAAISGKDSFDVSVGVVAVEADPQPRVTVVQALAKGDRGELAVELLTEIGVDEIVPWAAMNCVTRWRADRVDRSWQRWADAAAAAAKQSRRARFPIVSALATTADVVARITGADAAAVLHESASSPIGDMALPPVGEVVLVVGPEGGLDASELSLFEEAGARVVRLGPTVLRTSSAGIAAVAAMLASSPRWDVPSDAEAAVEASVEG